MQDKSKPIVNKTKQNFTPKRMLWKFAVLKYLLSIHVVVTTDIFFTVILKILTTKKTWSSVSHNSFGSLENDQAFPNN